MLLKYNLFSLTKITTENPFVKTLYLKKYNNFTYKPPEPGNFVNLWLPKNKYSDAIPMSISYHYKNIIGITVKAIGNTTKQLHKLQKGTILGILGPLGNTFKIKYNNVLLIGCGTGIAPLRFMINFYSIKNSKPINFTTILAAKTKSEILFEKEFKNLSYIYITTDDGSNGTKGTPMNIIDRVCEKHDIQQIICCGPEILMKKVLDFVIANGIYSEFSVERYMHCGVGLCGSCNLGKYFVCLDGTVFTATQLKNTEFGIYNRDEYGQKILIQ